MPQVSREVPSTVWNHLDIQQVVAAFPANESWWVHKSCRVQEKKNFLKIDKAEFSLCTANYKPQAVHICAGASPTCVQNVFQHTAMLISKARTQDLDTRAVELCRNSERQLNILSRFSHLQVYVTRNCQVRQCEPHSNRETRVGANLPSAVQAIMRVWR